MQTPKNISREDAKTQTKQAVQRFVPWSLCAIVSVVLITGCKKEDAKVYPQDRLTVEYSIDRHTIHVGDPSELILTSYYPTNGTVQLPEIGREKDIVILKRDWKNIPRKDGLTQSQVTYDITSFRLGEHEVCTNAITCQVGNETFTTNFPSITLKVESSLPENASSTIEDIKPVKKLPGRIPRWGWTVLVAAVVAFLAGLITTKLWKHKEKLFPVPPPIPPHVLALKALQALKSKGLLEKNECEPFYTELSMILRQYLDGRFHLNAPDETTEEIVEELSRSPELSGTQRNILQEFMRQADMVKFAKGQTDRVTMETAFDTTQRFVDETKQIETELN